jgi:hypothetical protein
MITVALILLGWVALGALTDPVISEPWGFGERDSWSPFPIIGAAFAPIFCAPALVILLVQMLLGVRPAPFWVRRSFTACPGKEAPSVRAGRNCLPGRAARTCPKIRRRVSSPE